MVGQFVHWTESSWLKGWGRSGIQASACLDWDQGCTLSEASSFLISTRDHAPAHTVLSASSTPPPHIHRTYSCLFSSVLKGHQRGLLWPSPLAPLVSCSNPSPSFILLHRTYCHWVGNIYFGYYLSLFTRMKAPRDQQLRLVHCCIFMLGIRSSIVGAQWIYIFWLWWVSIAAWGLTLVAGIRDYSAVAGFWLRWLLLFWSTGSRAHRLQGLQHTGLVALQHVGSSWTRGRTHVPCIGRRILNPWTTKEAQ